MEEKIAGIFAAASVKRLRNMLEHIEVCIGKLDDGQIWNRGNENENSVGNLVLHVCGNARQWVIAGVGGEKDVRDRDSEFSARGGWTRDQLISLLIDTVNSTIRVIESVTPERLAETVDPQTGPVPVLEAIYQVVGHFQQHTGQIIFATKLLTGEDLALVKPPSRQAAQEAGKL